MQSNMFGKDLVFILAFSTLFMTSFATFSVFAESGSTLYKKKCFSCHDSGLVSAPRLGDINAWKTRTPKGIKALTQTVIKGKNAMPPRGGTQYTDAQIEQVIVFMLSKLKK